MSIITLLYAGILPTVSKRYHAKWSYLIWLIIGIGWLIPFRPLIKLPLLPTTSPNKTAMPVQVPFVSYTPDDSFYQSTSTVQEFTNTTSYSIWEILFFIWVLGAITMLTYHVMRHTHFMKMVDRWSEAVTTKETMTLLDELKKEQQIQTNIPYKICSMIASPMMVGIIHPIILMPPIALSKSELTLILRHELIHYKRKDIWYKIMLLAATIIHWYNPFVYLMAKATSLQCEISCDALVLQKADMQTRVEYGETILCVIRNANIHHTALSTTFYGRKKGMKHRITSMLDNTRKKTGIVLFILVVVAITLTGTTLVSGAKQTSYIENTAFTKEEYNKLLALRYDGYKKMSVASFQQKVWAATDTPEYRELLERFYMDEQLEQQKDTNDIASFLFYELTPLMAENWQTRYFSNSFTIPFSNADDARFEYTCTITIEDANQVNVGQYNKTRKVVMSDLSSFVKSQSEENLQDGKKMISLIDQKVNELTKSYNKDSISIDLWYNFIPVEKFEINEASSTNQNQTKEKREYPYATQDDYESLLKLKTTNYKDKTLAAFNEEVLTWSNDNYERMERIDVDTAWNDYAVALTQEELSFVTLSYGLSGMENGVKIINERFNEKKKIQSFGDDSLVKDSNSVYCRLYYQMSYSIPDNTKITVGERDRCVGGVIQDIRSFWEQASLDEVLSMSEDEIKEKLQTIAKQYSNDLIQINFNPAKEWFTFEKMDERKTRN